MGGGTYDPHVIKLHASSRPRDDVDADPHRWTVEAADYDSAYAEAVAALPDGWILLHVQVER